MIFKILTLFPEFFQSPLQSGLLGKAVESGKIKVEIIDIRSFAEGNYRHCDDPPYGGGSGMVLMPGPLSRALEAVADRSTTVVLTSPGGKLFNQEQARMFSGHKGLCIICGHYEGVDQRIIDRYVDHEISIGDYILSGGEYAALVIIDAVSRYVPGFMSNRDSLKEESFEDDLLEYPHYTRPVEIFNERVPDILLSGNHKEIDRWRYQQSIEKTKRVRPELYKKHLMRKLLGE